MEINDFSDFIIKNVKSMELTESETSKIFENVICELFKNTLISAICPLCEVVSKYKISKTAILNDANCLSCNNKIFLVTGKIRTKRYDDSYGLGILHIRFIDGCERQRYVQIGGAYLNPEFKSKDNFSLCIARYEDISTQEWICKIDEPRFYCGEGENRGMVAVLNTTINRSGIFKTEYIDDCLDSLNSIGID